MGFYNPIKHFRQRGFIPPEQAPCLINVAENYAKIGESSYKGVYPHLLPNGRQSFVARFDYTCKIGDHASAHAVLDESIYASAADLRKISGAGNIIHAIKTAYQQRFSLKPRTAPPRAGLKAQSSDKDSPQKFATSVAATHHPAAADIPV